MLLNIRTLHFVQLYISLQLWSYHFGRVAPVIKNGLNFSKLIKWRTFQVSYTAIIHFSILSWVIHYETLEINPPRVFNRRLDCKWRKKGYRKHFYVHNEQNVWLTDWVLFCCILLCLIFQQHRTRLNWNLLIVLCTWLNMRNTSHFITLIN